MLVVVPEGRKENNDSHRRGSHHECVRQAQPNQPGGQLVVESVGDGGHSGHQHHAGADVLLQAHGGHSGGMTHREGRYHKSRYVIKCSFECKKWDKKCVSSSHTNVDRVLPCCRETHRHVHVEVMLMITPFFRFPIEGAVIQQPVINCGRDITMRTSSQRLAAVRKREAMLLASVNCSSLCLNLGSYLPRDEGACHFSLCALNTRQSNNIRWRRLNCALLF